MSKAQARGPLRVLLVEDDPVQARLVRELLSRGGEEGRACDVTVCPSMASALSHPGEVDVVVLDLGLPDMDADQVVPRMVARYPDRAVVVLTGRDERTHGARAVEQGAQDFLMKDEIDGPSLYRALRYAMVRVRLASALDKSGQREKRPT